MSTSNKLSIRVRKERGIEPRKSFAPILGVSEQVLFRIEHGTISPLSLKKIAKYFNMTITEALNEYHEQV